MDAKRLCAAPEALWPHATPAPFLLSTCPRQKYISAGGRELPHNHQYITHKIAASQPPVYNAQNIQSEGDRQF